MRVFLAVLLAFLIGVFVGRMLPVEEEPAREPPVERADRPDAERPPPRLEPSGSRPVPDPARETPKPGTKARQRRPGAPSRLPVAVEVIAPGGGTPEGVKLHWARRANAKQFSWMSWKAPATDLYTQPGDVWVHATGGIHGGFRSAPAHVAVVRDAPKPTLRLQLEERPGIHGRVALPGTFDRPRIAVRLQRLAGSELPADFVFRSGGKRARVNRRDGFRYVFTDLEPGHYAVALSLGGRDRVSLLEVVQVVDRMVPQDLVVEAFDPKEFMEVTVLGPDGEPLRDVQVATCVRSKEMASAGGNVALVRENGTVVVSHNPRARRDENGRYAEGVYYLSVRSRKHGEILQEYDPNEAEPVTIRYGRQGTVLITLRGYVDSPAAGKVRVGFRRRAGGETGVRNPKRPGADGVLDFGERQPGAYDLLMLGPDHRMRWMHTVEVASGENRIEVPLPEFFALEVHHPPEAEKPRLSLTRVFEDGTSWTTRGEASEERPGVRTYVLLTAGTYSFEGFLGERRVLKSVTIPNDRVLRLDG